MSRPYPTIDLDELLKHDTCGRSADSAPKPAYMWVRGTHLKWLCPHCGGAASVEVPAPIRRFVAAVANDRMDDAAAREIAADIHRNGSLDRAAAMLRAGRL